MRDPIDAAVALCESYADDRFEDDADRYTQVTKWEDGDFKVRVKHGIGHEDDPYRHEEEVVSYRHFDGVVVYAKTTRLIDRHRKQVDTSVDLERPGFAPDDV